MRSTFYAYAALCYRMNTVLVLIRGKSACWLLDTVFSVMSMEREKQRTQLVKMSSLSQYMISLERPLHSSIVFPHTNIQEKDIIERF